jgi:hypothetical protein
LRPVFDHPRWPAIRATLMAMHLLAVTAVACPAPVRSVPASSWKRPAVQEELQGWSDRLNALGFSTSAADVQAWAIAVQARWSAARRSVVWPFQKYLRAVGAAQGWYMFTGPDREPQRFILTFTTSARPSPQQPAPAELVFELGYRLNHPELVLPDFLDDHRIRRALFQASWSKSDNTFRLMCDAFNQRLRRQRVDIVDVTCQLMSRPVEHPFKRQRVRTDKLERELTIRADGSSLESRDGVAGPPKGPQRANKPATVKQRERGTTTVVDHAAVQDAGHAADHGVTGTVAP